MLNPSLLKLDNLTSLAQCQQNLNMKKHWPQTYLDSYGTKDCMKLGSDIHIPIRMNCNNFGRPLNFHLAPPSGQNIDVSLLYNSLVYDQIPPALLCV